jgi:hypothetical protein
LYISKVLEDVLNLTIPTCPVGCCAVVPDGMMIPPVGLVPTIPSIAAEPCTSKTALGSEVPIPNLPPLKVTTSGDTSKYSFWYAYNCQTSSALRARLKRRKLAMEPLNSWIYPKDG